MTSLGEDEFRKVETAVLDQVQAYYGTVVSTGSMAPVYPENWSKFRTGAPVCMSHALERNGKGMLWHACAVTACLYLVVVSS
jgi:shikimate kinase